MQYVRLRLQGDPSISCPAGAASRPEERRGSRRLPLVHPAFRRLPPPLIVVGMHRSGTSLATGLLATLGIYLGPQLRFPSSSDPGRGRESPDELLFQSGYGEAGDFFALNELLLARAGAAWNRPEPFLRRREEPLFGAGCAALLQAATFRRLRSGYLAGMPEGHPGLWAWKDPRTSLTLPFWLRLFPDARVLHVRRDPEGVVRSLIRRAQAWQESGSTAPRRPNGLRLAAALINPAAAARALHRRLTGAAAAPAADPCLDPEYCRVLCDRYVLECNRYRSLGDRYLELRYEDVVADPEAAAETLARFSGSPASPEQVRRAAELVRTRRSVPA